jgi:PAS domain S-box-containing protein
MAEMLDSVGYRGRVASLPAMSQALQRALLSWDGLLEWLPVGIYTCDAEGCLVQYNRRAAEIWGQSPDVGDGQFRPCGAHKAFAADGEPLSPETAPMSELLATGKPIRDRELIFERPDGTRVTILANLDPLFDDEGRLVGGVNCFQDISERKAAEERFKAREGWYHGLLDALPAAIYTTDAEGRITYFNQDAVELSGRRPVLGSDEWCVSWKLRAADGMPIRHEDCPMAVALKTGEPVRGTEMIAERPDGTRTPILPYPTPLRDASGRLIGAVNMVVDISDRKRAEEQKTVLLRELAHRVNNTFAVILAITQQSLRTAPTPQAFAEGFTARLQALARAHSLLLAQDWAGADLAELAKGQIAPFRPDAEERLKIAGPNVVLEPAQTIALGAVLHELATNACKYGALSVPSGRVELNWNVTAKNGVDHVCLTWTERDGPQVKRSAKPGLGSRIIRRGLPNAKIDWRLAPLGVTCKIDLAIERRRSASASARELKVPSPRARPHAAQGR